MTTNEEKTIVHVLQNRIKKYRDRDVFKHKKEGRWIGISWQEFGEKVKNLSCGLLSLGVQKGNCVCILSANRPEWVISDFGILSATAITVPIYPTYLAHDCAYIINHCEAKVLFVENQQQLDKILSVQNKLPNLKKIIVFDEYKSDNEIVTSFDKFLDEGKKYSEKFPDIFDKKVNECAPEDIATMVYTSGTTGPPKGSMITHANIMFVCRTCKQIWTMIDDTETHLSYLPLSHVYERAGAGFFGIYNGGTSYFARSYDTIGEDVVDAKPTLFLGVPRVYEKVYQRILGKIEASPPLRKKIFWWAVKTGKEYIKLDQEKKQPSLLLSIKYKIADKLVFSKLRNALGGKVKYLISSAAPLSKEIQEFFNACGFRLFEAWGMTECCGPATMNTPHGYKIGTVGRPIPGVEIKIADDGEILIKGGNVFLGYYKDEEATRNAIVDGWLHTGDIGVIDEDGYLKITDRKKDIIITAGGKNIAPQNIENMLKTNPLIQEAVVIGDRKPYLTALITLAKDEIEKYAKEKNIEFKNYEDLINHPDIKKVAEEIVNEKNLHLAQFEKIKKFTLLPQEFSIETGELTPTLKVKRKVVNEKFKDIIEKMYRE